MDYLINGVGISVTILQESEGLDPSLTLFTKINFTWIKA